MTHRGFNNSLIIKRFAFEILNNFTHLAYIAFIRLEVLELKKELMALYAIDEIRRIITESLIPYITKSISQRKMKITPSFDDYIKDKLTEIKLPKYDSFDDYLEVVIQFGYITLFAASFPLAAFWSIIFNTLEVFSDFFKLKTSYRRPIALNADGIGSWKNVLNTMCVFCVLTNLIIISFSSDQISHIFPSLFIESNVPASPGLLRAQAKQGKGQLAISVLFIIEHIFFIILYILRQSINPNPHWLRIHKIRRS